MSAQAPVLHETPRRLRVALPPGIEPGVLVAALKPLDGVGAVRVNRRAGSIVIHHDGRRGLRSTLLRILAPVAPAGSPEASTPPTKRRRRTASAPAAAAAAPAPANPLPAPVVAGRPWLDRLLALAPVALAVAAPLASGPWRTGLALGTVAARTLAQRQRLLADPPAAALDTASLAALVLAGQVPVVSTSVLLRALAEGLSSRLVGQADDLLDHLLPTEAERYRALREPGDRADWWPLRRLRAGDRIRLYPGDVVPLDGCVQSGEGLIAPLLPGDAPRPVHEGDAVSAGERVQRGSFELRAEADAEHSRLARLRTRIQHVMAAREPLGRLSGEGSRGLTLPLVASALVYGFTRDGARAAALLQSDPQQGIELAQPLAREAAMLALARNGWLASGLEAVSRLAAARVLVLQDSGVLACGRWTVDHIEASGRGGASRVRQWLARLAGAGGDGPGAPAALSLPDRLVRDWHRHGALLRSGGREVHLASPTRLRAVWGLDLDASLRPPPAPERPALRRAFAVVVDGQVTARVVLASAWRPRLHEHLADLVSLGFEHIALAAEDRLTDAEGLDDRAGGDRQAGVAPAADFGPPWIAGSALAVADWMAGVDPDASPAVVVHTVLRDAVPPGSLGLAPLEADAGAHGVLVGDPLVSLAAARRLSQAIEQRLRRRRGAAVAANAALMTAGALRLVPPMATTLLHHGATLLLLLDSLRLEELKPPAPKGDAPAPSIALEPQPGTPPGLAEGGNP